LVEDISENVFDATLHYLKCIKGLLWMGPCVFCYCALIFLKFWYTWFAVLHHFI